MYFPQLLYVPTLKDSVAQFQPQAFVGQWSTGAAAATVVQSTLGVFSIPEDHVFLLTGATILANAGAAQTADELRLEIAYRDSGAVLRTLHWLRRSYPGVQNAQDHWVGEIPLLTRHLVVAVGTYNAAAATNTTFLSITGTFIPRGNWSEF